KHRKYAPFLAPKANQRIRAGAPQNRHEARAGASCWKTGAARVLLNLRHLAIVPLLILMAGFFSFAQAQEEAAVSPPVAIGLPNVIDMRVSATPERARLVIDLAGRTEFALVSLSGPDRLAIDVRAGTFTVPEPAGKPAGEGMIAEYVMEQAAPDRVRTTLTLS